MDEKERIVAAAVFHGCTLSMEPPARHHTILNHIACVLKISAIDVPPENQGFLTSKGRFVGRTEGYYIASSANQILRTTGNKGEPTLYSEDMW